MVAIKELSSSSYRSSVLSLVILLLIIYISSIDAHHNEQYEKQTHDNEYIELSYPINNQTFHWVSLQDVAYKILIDGDKVRGNTSTTGNNGTYHVKSDRLEIDLHSGTHMDAPNHFAKGKWSIEQIPLNKLMDVPVAVIDLSSKCKMDRKYEFTKEDIIEFEKDGQLEIKRNSLVLIYTGLSEFWLKGKSEYFGTDSLDPKKLTIPGFSRGAAEFLVQERKVVGVGLDAPSADGSTSFDSLSNMDPIAHEIFNSANVYIIENVNSNLKKLINQTNARITTLPLPIETASGSPIRLIAQTNSHSQSASTSSTTSTTISALLLITLFITSTCFNPLHLQ